jgi:enoyl-CoA hydratase
MKAVRRPYERRPKEDPMYETLNLEVVDHVATVTMTSKTFVPQLFADIGALFRGLAGRITGSTDPDDDIRAVVFCSDQKCFTYGLDLMAAFQDHGEIFMGGMAGERQVLLSLIRLWQADVQAVADCPVPVIVAIHGWCIGAGLDLASACDIRLASADARISLRETKVAIVADIGSLQRLPAIIGKGHMAELAYTGADVDAARAEAIGLVNHVYADREALMAGALAMAAEIAANSPLVVKGVKDVLTFSEGKPVADGLAYVAAWNSAFLASEDIGEALQAFMQKRAPSYKGR